jgi:hypothetical protein
MGIVGSTNRRKSCAEEEVCLTRVVNKRQNSYDSRPQVQPLPLRLRTIGGV